MSFRHTAITEYLYKGDLKGDLDKIQDLLDEYGHFEWRQSGMLGLGYFHGVIKDSNGIDTKDEQENIKDRIFKETGVRIAIICE